MVEGAVDLTAFVSAYARALAQQIRVERIIVFGSRARGSAGSESDLDLLVVSPDLGHSILHDIDVLRGCLPPHTFAIDTIGCTPDELTSAEPGSIFFEAAREGLAFIGAGSSL